MKNENEEVSRRAFLSKGVAAAATSSIIAIETLGAPTSKALKGGTTNPAHSMMSNDPVFTEDPQTLIKKTIGRIDPASGSFLLPSNNVLGTDAVNIKEFSISGTDITNALNAAINYLKKPGSYGGQILIPHGIWTSNGGHEIGTTNTVTDIGNSISIEGVGFNPNPGYWGTEIKLNSPANGGQSFMFRITADSQNSSLKNLSIDMRNNPSGGAGLIMTNHHGSTTFGGIVYSTLLENVGFISGQYGIFVDSTEGSTVLECNLNRFERCSFIGCKTAFYCNTINGGFSFDTCYFRIPAVQAEAPPELGTALYCKFVGHLSVEHCIFVGNVSTAHPNLNTTVLKTWGGFVNITFFDCQDEDVQFMYKNATNSFEYFPLVFRDCLIQSRLKFTARGTVIFDSCQLYSDSVEGSTTGLGVVQDDTSAPVRVYLKGLNNFFTYVAGPTYFTGGKIATFQNDASRILYEATEIGLPAHRELGSSGSVDATRGIVWIAANTNPPSIIVPNKYVLKADTYVLATLGTNDPGTMVAAVECRTGEFEIFLNQVPNIDVKVGFKLLGRLNMYFDNVPVGPPAP